MYKCDTQQQETDLVKQVKLKYISKPALSNRLGQEHAGSVGRLKQSLDVDPPRDFLDQHRRHSLRPQLLVDAQKIYFHHLLRPVQFSF